MKVNNVTCINLNKSKVEENELCTKIKNNEKYYKESNNFEKDENKNKSKLNRRTSNEDIRDKKKKTKLIKVNKENEVYDNIEISKKNNVNEKKETDNGIIKNKRMSIDVNTVEKNIEKIENSIKKLDEIEKKLIDDINECDKYIEFYDKSKSLLDSKDFKSDVGREEEINEIRTILKRCSTNSESEGIFLTGPSGQGKTYSIFYIINEIEKEKKQKKKEKIEYYKNIDSSYFYVSCSNSEKPYDIFVDILQQITNKDKKHIFNNVKQKYHLNGLEEVKKLFINYTSKLSNLKIVIVDELDFIALKNVRMELRAKIQSKNYNEDVVKALYECIQNSKCKIILVGIANSLDLIKDYTHIKINQIIYKPYNEKQFMSIIRNKLNTLENEFVNKIFKGVSLNIHVRQISNRNGDIRSCFDAILRVFSDKKSDLDERKKNLIKLKEEILMNKIFNKQEKRNLCLLLNNQKDDKKKNESIFTDQKSSREEINELELSTNKRSNFKKREKDDKSLLSRASKKSKMENNNTNESNIYNEDTNDTFFLEKNETPLLNNRGYKMENKFNNDTQNLKFTDLKNENTFGYETLRKEVIKIQNNNETLSEILIRKNFNANDNESFYDYSQYTPKQYYESPFKVLYKNETDNKIHSFRDKDDILNNINVEKLESFDKIIENQIKNIESKYEEFLSTSNNNTVMISDIKKITDKMPLEEHKDILFKIKSLPLIQKICLYASCNVVNNTHLNLNEESQEDLLKNEIKNIEITYSDIQRCFRDVCNQLSETSYIKDILEGNSIEQAIEHFEELGILINSKKNQKNKEKNIKIPKGLTPRFANKKNNKNFSSQSKLNSIYYFNLPVCVIKQTLREISSILSSLDGNANF
ncbi:conserved Plasmodium protein, unknown function [Plasmodium gallinaceum]|uniref:ORC1/DEAH AAA+ ATPase domain-containing protein n=1 Tax=Plasmodium gallinaceum TaxID=5849 RepID=A0A1J1GZD3_PLAGA|nr:conserved Plasmodium protein, unknown function [Plasmodium gallinaceum]CRG97809.1 conserved Plasmodium protein, unknown function [Plasmodium gallinaceum]